MANGVGAIPRFAAVLAIVLSGCSMLTTPPVATSTFEGQGFTFEYPQTWRVISGFEHAGLHGPTVLAAVGIGDFDLGCTSTPNSVSCDAGPQWTVPDDGIVLAYRISAWIPSHPQPAPILARGERWVRVGGRDAVLSLGVSSMSWHVPGAPEFIEVRWGGSIDDADARTLAEAVISTWHWADLGN